MVILLPSVWDQLKLSKQLIWLSKHTVSGCRNKIKYIDPDREAGS
jgi:hypothetical protein